MKKWTMAAVAVGLFLMFGTIGALENDGITISRAIIQSAVILLGMGAAIKIGRLTEGCE